MSKELPISITHFKQPSEVSCMPTCLAMVLGIDPTTLINELGLDLDKPTPDRVLERAAARCGVYLSRSLHDIVFRGSVYIVSVPSLNMDKTLHALVVDGRGDEFKVYDPQAGIPGKRFYAIDEPIGSIGFSVMYEVILTEPPVHLRARITGESDHG